MARVRAEPRVYDNTYWPPVRVAVTVRVTVTVTTRGGLFPHTHACKAGLSGMLGLGSRSGLEVRG